jgi:choline dehydrogenase
MSDADFIVVGAGAGGGPLAANLAEAGFSVLLIDAGTDEIDQTCEVPSFHPFVTEMPDYSWEFFVKHYSDDNDPARDPKHHPNDRFGGRTGIFYPRASGIGGCTLHHAMITVCLHASDWESIVTATGDPSWSAASMRHYFDKVERPERRGFTALLNALDPTNIRAQLAELLFNRPDVRGKGWLPVSQADPKLVLGDKRGVLPIVIATYKAAKRSGAGVMPRLDPNHPRVTESNGTGFNIIPISVGDGRRSGARERILEGRETGKLEIRARTFVRKVLLEAGADGRLRAVGVECVEGRDLYGARHHRLPPGRQGRTVTYTARREVILAGGAFNTPQLLMLSGIGPAAHLAEFGIDARLDLPGVGSNLQDRYEVGVVARAPQPFKLLEAATFAGRDGSGAPGRDPELARWREGGGIYATNGAVGGVIKRSSTRTGDDPPDLYIFGVPGEFRGYEVGYSESIPRTRNKFTFAVLKGHTDNRSGRVRLRSADPLETPDIHFKYFEESNEPEAKDVESVVDGVKFVLGIYDDLRKKGVIEAVEAPVARDDDGLAAFVRANAWGHHASCTCPIGTDPNGVGLKAVVDSDFKVHGTDNLRIVDASVFPRIPGLFILASVYMISEKASDVIIAANRR